MVDQALGKRKTTIFGKIIDGRAPATILFQNSELIVIKDIRPSAKHHCLVIPKQHIRSVDELTSAHIPLLHRMREVGRQAMRDLGEDPDTAMFAFHRPPWISVAHLHLHVLSADVRQGWGIRKFKFIPTWPNCVLFDTVIEKLSSNTTSAL